MKKETNKSPQKKSNLQGSEDRSKPPYFSPGEASLSGKRICGSCGLKEIDCSSEYPDFVYWEDDLKECMRDILDIIDKALVWKHSVSKSLIKQEIRKRVGPHLI